MIKIQYQTIKSKGINYLKIDGKTLKFKPWLGDLFSGSYDRLMEKSIFPKKFNASIKNHFGFLKKELGNIHDKNVLELATGSGNISTMLPADNQYTGIDTSPRFLKFALKKFNKAGFESPELYICSAEKLPFYDDLFDVCICNLSLNFFENLSQVISETKKVLKNQGIFICSVPVPERNKKQSKVRGKLYSEEELKQIFENHGFSFQPYNLKNGALLYFKAVAK